MLIFILTKPKSSNYSIVMGGVLNNPSLTFNDGVRSIDYVLVWESGKEEARTPEALERRRVFEENLIDAGLQLERDAPSDCYGLHFVKVCVVICFDTNPVSSTHNAIHSALSAAPHSV